MAKNRIKNMGRRAFSLFLTLVMMTSILQISAFAYPNQVMGGYFKVDADGSISLSDASSVTDGEFTLSKTIKQTGENAFDITLTVETSQTVTASHSKAATVLVIDLSNSMDDNLSRNKSRMKAARDVAKDFLESYAGTDENAEQYLSIVWFGSHSGVDKDWVNVAGGEGKNSYNNIYNYLDKLEAPHNGDEGGTNLDAGLEAAKEQLAKRASIVEQKNVVLITDGKPTYHYNSKGNLSGTGGSGSKENNDAAKAEATAIKDAGATLYTVCIAAESDVCYEGETIYVCEHCEQTQDKHEKVTLCGNCGEDRSEHRAERNWRGHTTYYCYDRNNWYTYDAETYFYCDDSHTQEYSRKAISGNVTVGYFLSNDIATSASTAFNASTTDALEAALKAIASSIEASGYTGEGTTVTDPMGEYIVLGDVSDLSEDGVSAESSTITWALDPKKADDTIVNGDTTTYIYSITYPITLDTSKENFLEENEDGSTKYYPTNGYTYLSIPQDDGSTKEIAFLVPGVCGELPELEWHIEYYLQGDAEAGQYDDYTRADYTDKVKAELWSSVSAPEGYDKKYDNEDYKFVHGNPVLRLIPEGERVIRLYYDHILADVTVNHYYKTDRWTAEGEFIEGSYSDYDKLSGKESVRVNTSYTATEQTTYNQGEYEFVSADPSMTINVERDGENIINLYYSREIDERALTSAAVKHIYIDYGYVLENGKYVLKETGRVERDAESTSAIRATTVFTLSDKPLNGYQGYTLNEEMGDYASLTRTNGTLGFTVVEDASQNIRTLVFEKTTDNRVGAQITVNHYYTKSVTSVNGGVVSTDVDPNKDLGATVSSPVYVGESYTAEELNSYLGDTYVSDAGNAGKLVVDSVRGDLTIDLYYTLDIAPGKATIIIKHYWRNFEEVTIELTEEVEETIVDPESGETSIVTNTVVVGTTIDIRETEAHKIEGLEFEDYVGASYEAPQVSWGEGYDFNEDESNYIGIIGEDDVLNLYYDKWTDSDAREDASINVQHIYTTYLETIVNGEVDIVELPSDTVTENFPAEGEDMRAGDAFTAIPQPEYNGNTYVQITEDSQLGPVILQSGDNGTIVIEYKREISDLVSTDYNINYEYRTYTMTVENGVAGYYEAPIVENGEPIIGSGYVGQSISFGDGAKDGFTPLPTNPATSQVLAESGNSWTFVYEQYIPLAKGSVVVNHYYKTITKAIDGTESVETDEVLGTAVEKFIGESYAAGIDAKDFELKESYLDKTALDLPIEVTVSGDHVVDFYYEKFIDNSIEAEWSITHIYNHYTWDNELISSTSPEPATGKGYVSNLITAEAEPNDYELESVTYNGAALEQAPYTVSLQEGSNDIVLIYKKIDERAKVDVKVIHNYYPDEAAMVNAPVASVINVVSGVDEDSFYTEEQLLETNDGLLYSFHSADPADLTVQAVKGSENVIILNYIRTSAEYKVIHIYNRNGNEEGRTSETIGGLDGEVITAESIQRVTEYNGNSYNFISISGDITLDADEVQTIILTYNRSVRTPNPTPDPEPQPQPEPEPQPDPDPIEIPDEEPPLVELPDEEPPLVELPDEEVPLANVPKTGDATALYAALSALSGLGLICLNRKKKEEEDM